MILTVIKWCTVQGQLGSGQGPGHVAQKWLPSPLSFLSHPLGTDEEGNSL